MNQCKDCYYCYQDIRYFSGDYCSKNMDMEVEHCPEYIHCDKHIDEQVFENNMMKDNVNDRR